MHRYSNTKRYSTFNLFIYSFSFLKLGEAERVDSTSRLVLYPRNRPVKCVRPPELRDRFPVVKDGKFSFRFFPSFQWLNLSKTAMH